MKKYLTMATALMMALLLSACMSQTPLKNNTLKGNTAKDSGAQNQQAYSELDELREVCALHEGELVFMQVSKGQTQPFCVRGDKRIDALTLKNRLAAIIIKGDSYTP